MTRSTWQLPARAAAGLTLAALLAGCETQFSASPSPPGGPDMSPSASAPAATPPRVAALLPLTGPNAPLGRSMLDAIRLALASSPAVLDVEDTGGTASGAAHAASAALAAHDAVILGPLTSTETRAAADIASPAGIPVLAYSSDPSVARPGVWVLGVTPAQQVDRLISAAGHDGRQHVAAFLPDGPFGDAMAQALAAAMPGADIRRHDPSFGSINDGLKALSDFDAREGNRDAEIKTDRASTDPAVKAQADTLAATPVPPPPFDALLLADTGTSLQEIIDLLGPYDIPASKVRIMGPSLWGKFARKLGPIAGAWYAAPDPAARAGFAGAFEARYHVPPNGIDDFAYDSAALAAALSRDGSGFSTGALTRADGFDGTDGVFALLPDGHVRRGLAVFEIDAGGGSHIVVPAPKRLDAGA